MTNNVIKILVFHHQKISPHIVGATIFFVDSLVANFSDKKYFCEENLMVNYFMTKSLFCRIKFIISDKILVINKKNLSLNLAFVVMNI